MDKTVSGGSTLFIKWSLMGGGRQERVDCMFMTEFKIYHLSLHQNNSCW